MDMKTQYVLIPEEERAVQAEWHSSPPIVAHMKYTHIPAGVRAIEAAFEHDPLKCYINDTPDARNSRLRNAYLRLGLVIQLSMYVHQKEVYTVDGGDAIASYSRTGDMGPLFRFFAPIFRALDMFSSPEQKRRRAEANSKLNAANEAIFGKGPYDMVLLMELATTPEKQGRGYGTALVAAVTDIADAIGKRTWLQSSNIANTMFYERCGFVTVGGYKLGDTNPTWTKPPVIVRIMMREPRTRRSDGMQGSRA
ncbi:uncharacterized protein FIBRA_00804 [Fibroporia radiculosa]|uniref:N-acetyltransferase domain-containing protein n=1 Tax=Fibroporia radiculosa TaxID=599839 RepID=J4H0R3_9APHY|nr:uncharacterized protein FIBRA_00804 [Fibroporia radiculosa]CCL98799.1 predicted protein [Fibroporia radiculosa]